MAASRLLSMLAAFGPFCEQPDSLVYPFRPDVVAVIEDQGGTADELRELVEQAFARLVLEPNEIEYDTFQCVEQFLRVALFHDGRSFAACVRLAELAYEHPDVSDVGVNSLAWVATYIRAKRVQEAGEKIKTLRGVFDRLTSNRTLRHNARECLEALEQTK